MTRFDSIRRSSAGTRWIGNVPRSETCGCCADGAVEPVDVGLDDEDAEAAFDVDDEGLAAVLPAALLGGLEAVADAIDSCRCYDDRQDCWVKAKRQIVGTKATRRTLRSTQRFGWCGEIARERP